MDLLGGPLSCLPQALSLTDQENERKHKIMNKRGEITTDHTEIKRTIRGTV